MEVSVPVIVNTNIDENDENDEVINYTAYPVFMLSMTISICASICICCYYSKIKKLTIKPKNISINIKNKKDNDLEKLNGMHESDNLEYDIRQFV